MKVAIIAASIGLVAISAQAKEISTAEWYALGAQNKAAVAALEASNIALANANVSPWGTPAGIAYMKEHPYDACDLVRNETGFVLPGWISSCDASGIGGSGGNVTGR
jgi:hypothetical protein